MFVLCREKEYQAENALQLKQQFPLSWVSAGSQVSIKKKKKEKREREYSVSPFSLSIWELNQILHIPPLFVRLNFKFSVSIIQYYRFYPYMPFVI